MKIDIYIYLAIDIIYTNGAKKFKLGAINVRRISVYIMHQIITCITFQNFTI